MSGSEQRFVVDKRELIRFGRLEIHNTHTARHTIESFQNNGNGKHVDMNWLFRSRKFYREGDNT